MKVNQIISEMTSGCVSSVAMPIGNIKKRTTETTNVPGLKPAGTVSSKNKKKGQYANSVLESKTSDRPVQEAKLDEDDLILVPGQGMTRRTGFVKHDPDKAEHEGQTLKNSLHTIIRVATHLNKELSTQDNFPEWVSEKIGAIKHMMVTVMDYVISDKEMHGRVTSNETGGVIAGGGVGESIIETGSYNPLDQERQEQNAMDWSKRQFKNKELQGELGHEDNPNFDRNRNRGPFYIKINGKILRTRGEIKVFDYLNGARNYGSAILKKRPELKGKVFITNSPKDDEQGVEEGRFTVNRNTGAKLDPRTGVELPPKEKPLTMKQMFAQPKQPKLSLDDVWRKVEDVVGQIFPDGDPIDYLAPWLEQHGIRDFKIGEILDRAAKKNGYEDLYDYYDSMKDQYDRDNVAEAGHQSPHAKLAQLKAKYDAALKSPNPNMTTLRRIRDEIIKLEFDLGLKEGVAEGSIKDAEQALARHGQYKVDYEKKYGPMSGADLHQHEVMRKQLLDKKRRAQSAYAKKQGVAEGSGPQEGDEVYYGNRLVGWFKGYSKLGKIITEPNVDEMGDEYLNKDAYWDPQDKITIKPKQGVAEGFKNTYSVGDRVDGPLGTGTIVAVSKNINVDGRVKVKLDDPSRAGEDGKYKDSFVLDTTQLKHISEQGVAEGGILKSIKRAIQGWDQNAVGPSGEKLGNPREIVKRAKAMDTDTAKKVRAGLDGASEHSPAGLQKRVLDRKLKDVSESSEDPSYKKGWKLCDKDPSADPQHLFRKHGEGLDRNQFIKGFNDNAKLRGMSIYGDVSGDVDHSTLHYKEFKRDQGVAEGAKVDRMVKHIAKSERELGKSKDEAENIAWATANKRGMLDNKNKKSDK